MLIPVLFTGQRGKPPRVEGMVIVAFVALNKYSYGEISVIVDSDGALLRAVMTN